MYKKYTCQDKKKVKKKSKEDKKEIQRFIFFLFLLGKTRDLFSIRNKNLKKIILGVEPMTIALQIECSNP